MDEKYWSRATRGHGKLWNNTTDGKYWSRATQGHGMEAGTTPRIESIGPEQHEDMEWKLWSIIMEPPGSAKQRHIMNGKQLWCNTTERKVSSFFLIFSTKGSHSRTSKVGKNVGALIV